MTETSTQAPAIATTTLAAQMTRGERLAAAHDQLEALEASGTVTPAVMAVLWNLKESITAT